MSMTPKATNRLGRTAQRILRWLTNIPPSFARIQLCVLQPGGPDVLLELEAEELAQKPHEVTAQSIQVSAEEWSEAQGREARAQVTAFAVDNRVLARHNFKAGVPAEDDMDGSFEGMLAQNQRHLESMMRMSAMERGSLANAWGTVIATLAERVKELESENKTLRRKVEPISAEDQVALEIAGLESDERRNDRLLQLVKLLAGPKGKQAVAAVETMAKATGAGTNEGNQTDGG